MICSLVISPDFELSADGTVENVSGGMHILRRNLIQESLDKRLAEGCAMQIDIITPEDSEIHWLEHALPPFPTVIADSLREDHGSLLLVYPFVSSFNET